MPGTGGGGRADGGEGRGAAAIGADLAVGGTGGATATLVTAEGTAKRWSTRMV